MSGCGPHKGDKVTGWLPAPRGQFKVKIASAAKELGWYRTYTYVGLPNYPSTQVITVAVG